MGLEHCLRRVDVGLEHCLRRVDVGLEHCLRRVDVGLEHCLRRVDVGRCDSLQGVCLGDEARLLVNEAELAIAEGERVSENGSYRTLTRRKCSTRFDTRNLAFAHAAQLCAPLSGRLCEINYSARCATQKLRRCHVATRASRYEGVRP